MSTSANRLETKPATDEEIRRILAERDATFEQDRQTVVDGKKATAAIRRKLKHAQPR